MRLKKLSIICAIVTCLKVISNISAEEQQSFIRKAVGGGVVVQSIQVSDGNYTYLNYANGPTITKIGDLDNRISEVSLTFVDLPCMSEGCGSSLDGMAQTENGFVLVGWYREGGYYSATGGIVVNVSMEGRMIWGKIIEVDSFHSVVPAAGGGFIVSGFASGYPVLIKFNSAGEILWSKSFDILLSSFRTIPTLDGGFILAANNGDNEVNVLKMNGSGNIVWAVTLGIEKFILHSLIALSDQGFLLAGKPYDSSKLLLVRLSANGRLHSTAAYSLSVPDFFVTSLAQTPDGDIAIGGQIYKRTGSLDKGLLLKINDRYQLTVKKRIGFPESYTSIDSVFAKPNGSYLLFGWTSEEFSYPDTLFVGLNIIETAPGCISHNLSASKVLFGNISHKNLRLTPKTVSIPPGESIQVTSKDSNRQISDVCVN